MLPGWEPVGPASRAQVRVWGALVCYLFSFQRVLIQLTLSKDAETKQETSTGAFDMRGRTPFRVHLDPQIPDDYRILLTGLGIDKYPGKRSPQRALTCTR